MSDFIKKETLRTPTLTEMPSAAFGALARFTPSYYLGNPSGFMQKPESYDIWDENTLKQFKLGVASLDDYSPMLRLDTVDLYDNFDHTIAFPASGTVNPLNFPDKFFDEKRDPSPACPVKFQRIHFYGEQGGESKEYYSIFLAGKAVESAGAETWGPPIRSTSVLDTRTRRSKATKKRKKPLRKELYWEGAA